MPMYTATVIREVAYKRYHEKVELRATDDADANRKIRDMDRSLGTIFISIIPDQDEPATVDGVARQWVADDDHITVRAFRSDLEGERFLNEALDDEIWDDAQHALERDGSIMDLVYAYLKGEWDVGPGIVPDEE